MLDQQSVALVPGAGPVQVQGLLVSVAVPMGSGGLCQVDPRLWDQQLLGQEASPMQGLVRLLQGAVLAQHVPDGALALTEDAERLVTELPTKAAAAAALSVCVYVRSDTYAWSGMCSRM